MGQGRGPRQREGQALPRRVAGEGERRYPSTKPSRERRDDIHEPRRKGSHHLRLLPTSVKTVLTLPPTVWTAPMITTAIKEAIRAQLSPHFFEGQNATGGRRFAAAVLV